MTPTDKELFRVGPFPKGTNNRAKEPELPVDEKTGFPTAARALVNVDIDNDGWISTRAGTTKVISGVDCHSAWACKDFPWLLYVDANTFKATRADWNPVTIRENLTPQLPLSYAEINGNVFWSNGVDSGKVTPDLQDLPWGLAGPSGVPTLTELTGVGALFAGRYQLAVTFVIMDSSGNILEESGSTLAGLLEIAENGGIGVSAIPQPLDPRVNVVRVYCTPANVDILYQVRDLPVGMTSFTLSTSVVQGRGKALENQFESPMPAGQIVRYINGTLCVADNKTARWGPPLHYGQTRLKSDFTQEPFRITLFEPVSSADQGGMYICAGNKTWYLSTAPPKSGQNTPRVRVHDAGVVFGTGISVPAKLFEKQVGRPLQGNAAFWMDTEGVAMLGLVGGEVIALARDNYVAPNATSGSAVWKDINGIRQVAVSLRGTTVNKAAAGDYMTSSIERNGVRI